MQWGTTCCDFMNVFVFLRWQDIQCVTFRTVATVADIHFCWKTDYKHTLEQQFNVRTFRMTLVGKNIIVIIIKCVW